MSAGQLFREEAVRQGMTLAEYNVLAQQDATVDTALDERVLELLTGGGVVMEGRMSGWLAWRHGLPAYKVWVTCDEDERVRRLVVRDGGQTNEQREAMRDRVRREKDRYAGYYGADLDDLSIYDLVLDSSAVAPETLVERIRSAIRRL